MHLQLYDNFPVCEGPSRPSGRNKKEIFSGKGVWEKFIASESPAIPFTS